ncbi:hypothetical protein AVEN_219068-1 [Araneus ventricosus]|uniref:Uncharacterized protein n=1 Tax=Araneus ventricosus TaxID=182803 RepID=A0A4Y2GCG4_ARAVE|nr:hypothetical protein AVEN_219068-1 [Araneus ventricosus]
MSPLPHRKGGKDFGGSYSETRTFVSPKDFIYKCYSRNLHWYQSGSEPDTLEIPFNTEFIFGLLQLELYRIELFGMPGDPQVFLSVHSPFVSIHPIIDGHAIRSGYTYRIRVQLEKEEHLLPPPYQTNCRDNGPSKDAKNFTNPNSFQMCLEMCDSEYRKAILGCDTGMIMASSPTEFCQPRKYMDTLSLML